MPVPPTLDDARRRAVAIAARTAILVEGWSDQAALETLAVALGAPALERLLDAQGELEAFRVFPAQPAQRGRDLGAHLHRFLGIRSGRKIRYGGLRVEALPMDRVPAPLLRVLAHAGAGAPGVATST